MNEEDKKDVTIGEQFKDLPMEELIGGPLAAAAQTGGAYKTLEQIIKWSKEPLEQLQTEGLSNLMEVMPQDITEEKTIPSSNE